MLTDASYMLKDAYIMLSEQGRKRRVGRAIAKHRRLAGMSQGGVARALRTGQTTVSAWEQGKNTPSMEVLDRLDRLFSTEHALVQMWDALGHEGQGYASWFANVIPLERESREIREYAPLFVPGLLQTERYARAVLVHGPAPYEEASEHLEGRSARQDLLAADEGPRIQFVVEEYVLRRPIGGQDVLAEQLENVARLAALPRITVQVVPMDSVEHPGVDGGFVLYEHPDRGSVAYTETRYNSTSSDNQDVTDGYMAVWAELRGIALPARASANLIQEISKGTTDDFS